MKKNLYQKSLQYKLLQNICNAKVKFGSKSYEKPLICSTAPKFGLNIAFLRNIPDYMTYKQSIAKHLIQSAKCFEVMKNCNLSYVRSYNHIFCT